MNKNIFRSLWSLDLHTVNYTGIILCMCLTNERRLYIVTSSLIGWAHTQNDPYYIPRMMPSVHVNCAFSNLSGLGWLCFQFVSVAAVAAVTAFASHTETFVFNLRHLGQKAYRSGKMYSMTSPWPRSKVTAVAMINKNVRLHIENHSSNHYKFFFQNFMCFHQVKHSLGQILGLVGLIEVNEQEVHRLHTGSTMSLLPLTLPMTLNFSWSLF